VFSDVLGNAVINFPLEFIYSVQGVLLWLAIVAVLSALASLWPALRATRVSVRESLAYE
jgi:ABC-type lipoprotein release transport system permease subunit